MTEITIFHATDIKAQCPKCKEWLDGWIGDPRGSTETCDYCGEELTIHPDAYIEFEY